MTSFFRCRLWCRHQCRCYVRTSRNRHPDRGSTWWTTTSEPPSGGADVNSRWPTVFLSPGVWAHYIIYTRWWQWKVSAWICAHVDLNLCTCRFEFCCYGCYCLLRQFSVPWKAKPKTVIIHSLFPVTWWRKLALRYFWDHSQNLLWSVTLKYIFSECFLLS